MTVTDIIEDALTDLGVLAAGAIRARVLTAGVGATLGYVSIKAHD